MITDFPSFPFPTGAPRRKEREERRRERERKIIGKRCREEREKEHKRDRGREVKGEKLENQKPVATENWLELQFTHQA